MITKSQASKIVGMKLEYHDKRQIYELTNINSLIHNRIASQASTLIYTVYKNNQTINEFAELLKKIKSKLEENGYCVTRVNHDSKEFYIFNISWEDNNDVLDNIEV
jgi:hypothetical protein